MDMDRILMTGNELYTYLQRSSSISDRYLLVEELPHLFECYNKSFKFHANASIASVILEDGQVNYAEFNALPLDTALRLALTDSDGCFVCFSGNTILVGDIGSGVFIFDSHSRSFDGMCSVSGKSTRLLFQNASELYSYIQNIALSMGYKSSVECNLTSVSCPMNIVNNVTQLIEEIEDVENVSESPELENETCDENDDLIFVRNEQFQFSFIPLTVNLKKQICQNLNFPFINDETSNEVECSRMSISKPRVVKEITGDGNCFFRAISFSITNSEAFHNVIRNAVCVHMMENAELFKRYLNGDQSIETYLSSTRMLEEGIWATEVEIYATAHLLNVDILTFSGGRWLRFAVDELDPPSTIYLNHQQNHYNVVL